MSSSAATSTSQPPILIRFYDPYIKAPDSCGRTLDSILKKSDAWLERSHDYIQVIFPLPEGSPFNPGAPIITAEIFSAFRHRDELRRSLFRSFTRILSFYGFDVQPCDGAPRREIVRSHDYVKQFRNWVTRIDHNHLRITRIIRSLRVLGLEDEAAMFFEALKDVDRDFPGKIGARSFMYWRRAVQRPLYLAPDEDDDDSIGGKKFLRDFENEKARKIEVGESSQNRAEPEAEGEVEVEAGRLRSEGKAVQEVSVNFEGELSPESASEFAQASKPKESVNTDGPSTKEDSKNEDAFGDEAREPEDID